MNLLSCGALITAVLYIVLIVHIYTGTRLDKLNIWSVCVCCTLCWWSLCDSFFYVAGSIEAAWFWHHLGALGWCGFIPVTAYYFLIMTHMDRKLNKPINQIAFWILPTALTIYSVFMKPTPFAEDLTLSRSGLGWTFVQRFTTPFPVIYLVILFLYFGTAFVLLYRADSTEHKVDIHKLAIGFIVLDFSVIAIGFISIYVIPYFTDYLPPMGFVSTAIFLIGYRYELWGFDLMHVELALDPRTIFNSSLDAILITDENFCILYGNGEAVRILKRQQLDETDFHDYLNDRGKEQLFQYANSNEIHVQLDLELRSGTPVICSISRSQTRKQQQNVFIISLHDIEPLHTAQTQLRYLANNDELTGLPNRRKLGELLDLWALDYRKEQRDFELFFLDLNDFKSINDNYGHNAGDLALKSVSLALESIREDDDVVARLAGDEFVFLHRLSEAESGDVAEAIKSVLAQIDCEPFAPGHTLSASIGSCRFSEVPDVRSLFKLSDERMYHEKNARYQQP